MSRSNLRRHSRFSLVSAVFLVAALGVACNSPTAPDQPDQPVAQASLRLSGAQVMVGNEVMNGQTVQPGEMHGGSTFFQAMLTGPNGPALGHTVQVQYQWPGGMGPGMMGNGPGPLYLYDDGTHGDPVAGDGIYCFDDQAGRYGFHMAGASHGQYHYEFFGFDHQDHHSNHVMVTVTVGSG